ncbi:MAG: GNAT family N-acetyltransferase [Bacillota bacterium]
MKTVIAEDKKSVLDHYKIRGEVFIIEQAIDWEEEFDGKDYDATLFVLYKDQTPIGAARLTGDHVGRVAVLKNHRHEKAGSKIMQDLEDEARRQGFKTLYLGAQKHVIPFYESIGYEAYGDIFLDAMIEHRMMKKDL